MLNQEELVFPRLRKEERVRVKWGRGKGPEGKESRKDTFLYQIDWTGWTAYLQVSPKDFALLLPEEYGAEVDSARFVGPGERAFASLNWEAEEARHKWKPGRGLHPSRPTHEQVEERWHWSLAHWDRWCADNGNAAAVKHVNATIIALCKSLWTPDTREVGDPADPRRLWLPYALATRFWAFQPRNRDYTEACVWEMFRQGGPGYPGNFRWGTPNVPMVIERLLSGIVREESAGQDPPVLNQVALRKRAALVAQPPNELV